MSAQTRYGFSTPIGAAGCIADLAPYAIDTFLNEEATGVMKLGVGVVQGTIPGTNIKLPATGATSAKFEGVTVNGRTHEYDLEGKLSLREGASIGVMRYGRVYVRVTPEISPKYGDAVELTISGENVGTFTNAHSEGTTIPIKARFLSGVDVGSNIAMIELFNQAE